MLKRRKQTVGGMILAICLVPALGFASSPTEQIQQTIEQVMKVLADPAHSDGQRKALLRETLMPRFDWLEMAKQALGKHWSDAAGRENEFVSTFADFLGNSYFGKIGSYRDEKIVYIRESVDNNRAQVNTKIVSENGEPTSVNYRLHRIGDQWKVYDVVVEDISVVVNYRSQFNRILAKGSFDDLMNQLKSKESTMHP